MGEQYICAYPFFSVIDWEKIVKTPIEICGVSGIKEHINIVRGGKSSLVLFSLIEISYFQPVLQSKKDM